MNKSFFFKELTFEVEDIDNRTRWKGLGMFWNKKANLNLNLNHSTVSKGKLNSI